jgi:ELWxxDGT repeat protein
LELWKSDGTATGTRLLQDIAPGAASSIPHAFTIAGSQIFFVADDNQHGEELWSMPVGFLSQRRVFLPIVKRTMP